MTPEVRCFLFFLLIMVFSFIGMCWSLLFMLYEAKFPSKKIYGCDGRGDANDLYMTRYTLLEWGNKFQICIHVFHRSDADDLHDHPWNFVTIPLWRGYMEEVPILQKFGYTKPTKTRVRTRIYPLIPYFREATHRHRVILRNNKRAVTLVFMGPYIRRWGFWVDDQWVYWKRYFKEKGC